MEFSNRLRGLREQMGLTQQDVADRLDLTRPAVAAWEHGKSRPRLDKLSELAGVLGVSTYYLLNGVEAPTDAPADLWPAGRREARGRSATVPVRRLGKTHAGDATEALEGEGPDSVEVPESVAKGHPAGFCLTVEGDCMNRSYPEGCMVLVDPELSPWPGCAVVAETAPGETVLRRYARGSNSLMLSADSFSEHDDLIWQGDDVAEVRLVGVVVWYQAACEEYGF